MKPQSILVTGGAGFIGSHSVDLFLRQGKEVIVLDNLSSGKLSNLDLQHPNLEFIEGDVLEFPLVKELIEKVEAVLHLAAIPSVQVSIDEAIYSFQVNLQGSLHVLEAVRQIERPVHIALASSAAVYGNASELPCRDNAPLNDAPLSPYALQKIQVEEYADLYFRLHQIKSVCLRYFNVYGPGQESNSPYSGVISRFLYAAQTKEVCTIYGDGMQTRDFIHVADIASANLLALQTEAFHGVVNIATGQPHNLLQLIDIIQESTGKSVKIMHKNARSGDIKASYAETKTAETQLAFSAKVTLSQGIKQLVDSLSIE